MSNNLFYKTLAAVSTAGIVVMAGIQVSTALKKATNSEDQLVKPSESISNTCPPSYAYTGEGFCRKFICTDFRKEVQILKRKHVCDPIALSWGRKRLVWAWGVRAVNKYVPAVHTPTCPNREPGLGWGSTCDEAKGLLPEIASKKRVRKPAHCLSGKLRPNHPMCRDDEGKIMSPMDMD